MPLQLAVIATAGGKIVSEANITPQIRPLVINVLQKIPRHDNRMSYIYDNYVFHYWVEHEIIYMCLTDKEVQTRIAFALLDECMKRFKISITRDENKYPNVLDLTRDACTRFDITLVEQLRYFNDPNTDKVSRVRKQIDEVKQVMLENIDSVLQRGDQIDVLVSKTTELNQQADGFRHGAKTLRRKMQWKNIKLMIIIAIIFSVLILVIAASICGITFAKCKRSPTIPNTAMATLPPATGA